MEPGENCGGKMEKSKRIIIKILILKKLQYHFQIKEMVFRYKWVGLTLNTLILIRVQYLGEIVC